MVKKKNKIDELLSEVIICGGTEQVPLKNLVVPEYYCREAINEKAELLKNEIQLNGFIGSIIVNVRIDGSKVVVDGVLRLKICEELGFKSIPVNFIKTSTLIIEKKLSVVQNFKINDFTPEDFEIHYPFFTETEFGIGGAYNYDKKNMERVIIDKSGVLKQMKIVMSFEDTEWAYEQLDLYKKRNNLKGRREAILNILENINSTQL